MFFSLDKRDCQSVVSARGSVLLPAKFSLQFKIQFQGVWDHISCGSVKQAANLSQMLLAKVHYLIIVFLRN